MKYKLILSYDGTHYSGWQIQNNAVTIQLLVQNALSTILRDAIAVIGSGRTDAGVHALAQTAHFSTLVQFEDFQLLASLNGLLPRDIRALHVEQVPLEFHARYSARAKIYRYHLQLSPTCNPFRRLYSLHLPYHLDLALLQAALSEFIGKRDFTSFSNESHCGGALRNPVRTLNRLQLFEEEGGIYLEFEADGFLYKMVRNITGTLIDVARGKLALESIPAIFAAKDRRRASPPAPAHGLFLVKAIY